MPHCHLFEPLLFTRQAPRDFVVLSNYPVPGHRNDGSHLGFSADRRPSKRLSPPSWLDGDRRFDGRIRIIADQLQILVLKIPELCWYASKAQRRQRTRRTVQLLMNLFEMVPVDVDVAKRMHKLSRH